MNKRQRKKKEKKASEPLISKKFWRRYCDKIRTGTDFMSWLKREHPTEPWIGGYITVPIKYK